MLVHRYWVTLLSFGRNFLTFWTTRAKSFEQMAPSPPPSPPGKKLRYVATCWVLLVHIWPDLHTLANNTQQVAAHLNTVAKRTQLVAPNNVAIGVWPFLLASPSVRGKQLLCFIYTVKAKKVNKNMQQRTLSGFITLLFAKRREIN